MGTKTVSLNMDYSPLNNVSSSGEDIEQFSLPAVSTTQYSRPKRRRKRKDFDSLKTHAISGFASTHCCRLGNCLLASVIIVLISSTCGMAVMLFYMSNTIADIQEHISNLQVAKETTSSSLLALQNRFDILTGELQQAQTSIQNHSTGLKSAQNSVSTLESALKAVKADIRKHMSNRDDSEEIAQELAKLGSEIVSIKSDTANLKQQDETITHRLEDMDASIKSFQQQTMESHASIGISSLTQTSDAGLLSPQQNVSSEIVLESIEELRRELSSQNETLKELDVKLQLLNSSSCSDVCAPLVQRVDKLEIYLREVQGEVQEVLTTSFENRVFNVTMSAGIEDVITRVINKKTSTLHQTASDAMKKADSLQGQLSRLEQMITMLNQHDTTVAPVIVEAVTNVTNSTSAAVTDAVTTTSRTDQTLASVTTVPSDNSARVNISNSDLNDLFGKVQPSTPVSLDSPNPHTSESTAQYGV